jgi:hypothetical protein
MDEKEITLTLKVKDIKIILTGLNELPRKQVNELFMKIDTEAYAQMFPKVEEKTEDGNN